DAEQTHDGQEVSAAAGTRRRSAGAAAVTIVRSAVNQVALVSLGDNPDRGGGKMAPAGTAAGLRSGQSVAMGVL
ncbi:MAG: hypothetical protein ACREMA_16395, partial [Longimicrobiales bacterium]